MGENNIDLDNWLVELESNDSNSMASVLCNTYDRDMSDKFMDKLEKRILHHDQEIERMCSANYKSFIDCIKELLQVRPNAQRLKRETADINSELTKSTDIIQRKAEELIKARRILVNSATSIEMLKKCLFVLDQYLKFNEQLREKKYFPALKTLESLENDHLPTVSGYRFAQSMCKEVPEFRLRIKRETKEDLNSFLEGLLVKSQKIGETVLERAKNEQLFDEIAGIDFCPVYRGLHIFTSLGFRDEFIQYYREQRQKQSRLAFNPPSNMNISMAAFHDYFSSVIGFFVIEDHLMGTTKDFIDSAYLNELWLNAVHSMTESLKQTLKLCRDASLTLEVEKLMMLFKSTIRNYGYNTDILAEIFVMVREQYNQYCSLSQYLGTIAGDISDPINIAHIQIHGKPAPKDSDTEFQLVRKVNEQIDEFLSLANYDWTRAEASGQASSFILDLIAWLRSTFETFINLEGRVAQRACMSACKHIAQSLRGLLLSDDVRALSLGALEQFNLDLMQCELFASSEPVEGFKEGDLLTAFAELRQLCDLFLYEDYSTFMSDMGKQQNKYLRVTTATALAVVDKLREHDRGRSVFALKKTDKQKLRDTFAERLKQVHQQQSLKDQQYQQQS